MINSYYQKITKLIIILVRLIYRYQLYRFDNLFHREIFYIFLSFFLPFFFFFEGGNRIGYISIKKYIYIYSRNRREKIGGIKYFSDEVFEFSNFRHHHHHVGIYLVSSPAIRPDRCRNRVRGMHTHKREAHGKIDSFHRARCQTVSLCTRCHGIWQLSCLVHTYIIPVYMHYMPRGCYSRER